MKELDTEKTLVKIINAMEIVEMSQPTIARKAIAHALLSEDDEEATSLFEELRVRAHLSEEDALTIDGYMHNLDNLRKIATLSAQPSVSKDLSFLISFFSENNTLLYRVLKNLRRQHLNEGLRRNYMNN